MHKFFFPGNLNHLNQILHDPKPTFPNHLYVEGRTFDPFNWIGFAQMTDLDTIPGGMTCFYHTTSFLNRLQILFLNKKIDEPSFMFSI